MTFRYPFVCMIIEPVFPVNASPNVPTHLSLFGTMPSSLNSTLLSITSIWRSPLFSSTWEPSALTLLSPAINMINNQFRDLKSKFPRPQSDESSTFSVDLFLLQMIDVHLDLLNCLIEMMQAFSAYDPSDVTEQFLLGYCKAYSMLQGLCEAPPCLDLLSEVHVLVSRKFLESIEKIVISQRPLWRVDAAQIDKQCDFGLLMSDHSVFPHAQMGISSSI
ncbi:hypothetical protein AAHE18_16G273300 [Arachis hypogaea]|uniref:Inositol-pentakisphosphate 2-kinase n=1 Tax=Arachis hypogaea TaxID=3818 RepID=A0A444YWJ4_ARAHY|nr:hypothetical protein Ahy_B06g086025 [Arachis hypogaea]